MGRLRVDRRRLCGRESGHEMVLGEKEMEIQSLLLSSLIEEILLPQGMKRMADRGVGVLLSIGRGGGRAVNMMSSSDAM